MLAWAVAASMYFFGALTMALLVVEWNYGFTPRSIAVIICWPIVALSAFVGAIF